MSLSFTVKTTIKASAETIYNAWLDSKEHSAMTGGVVTASSDVGGKYTAHNDYIGGENKELVANQKIVQTWRSTEFEEGEPDSLISVTFEEQDGKTTISLTHTDLPTHQAAVAMGWEDYYFTPIKEYFEA
ncbi:MAG: SRPBCC domain-containing protein [Flavobacteriales bacterium]|nr:SRPBCC domain-containing protein [Flavobacteriales bacterium]